MSTTGGYSFAALVERFLAHLQVNRRCSPLTVTACRSDYRKIETLLRQVRHSLDVRDISSGDLAVCTAGLPQLSAVSV